jgi:hypothetical protein
MQTAFQSSIISQASHEELISELRAFKQKSTLLSRPGFLIRRLHQLHGYLFSRETVAFAITPVQYSVLTSLSEHDSMDQVSIAREVGLERTTVAEVIARMESRGLVSRKNSKQDRRVRIVKITAKGKRLVEQMSASVERAHDLTISPLSQEDQDRLMVMLVRLLEANNRVGNVPFRLD